MAALTGALLALSAANTVGQFAQQRRAASIAQQQGNAEGSLFDTNASLADAQATDATARGNQAASRIARGGRLLTGEQRAAFAASGIDPSSGSAGAVVAGDRSISELDALTVKNNAALEAWGYSTQAAGLRMQGAWARAGGGNVAGAYRRGATSTLLSGAADLASIYQTSPKGVSRAPMSPSPGYGTSTYGSGGMFGKP